MFCTFIFNCWDSYNFWTELQMWDWSRAGPRSKPWVKHPPYISVVRHFHWRVLEELCSKSRKKFQAKVIFRFNSVENSVGKKLWPYKLDSNILHFLPPSNPLLLTARLKISSEDFLIEISALQTGDLADSITINEATNSVYN